LFSFPEVTGVAEFGFRAFNIVLGPNVDSVLGFLKLDSADPKVEDPKSVALPTSVVFGTTSNLGVAGEVTGGFAGKSSGVAPKGVSDDFGGGGDFTFSVSLSGKTSKTSWPLIEAGSRQKENRQIANALAIEANLFIDLSDESHNEKTQTDAQLIAQ